jgi:lipoprotein-anchoring transpeptidase ErfK/SrfK
VKVFQAKVQGLATPDGVVSPNGATILFLGGLHTTAKQIIVDLDEQLLYAYEGTKRIYEFDCASGDNEHPTAERPALFEVLRKEKIYRSRKYDAQMNYALFFSADGKAIHQSNVVGLTSLLKKWGANYFGSHGCVRLSEEDAQTLFAWATPKTEVFIDMSRKAFS